MPEANAPEPSAPSVVPTDQSEALRTSEARYRSILETALDGVLVMDYEGKIVEWNTAAETIFGSSREEVLGSDLAETIIPERLREAHRRGLAHYLSTGEGPVLRARLELPALRRDGSEFPVELSISPLPGAEKRLFVGFVRDISERKNYEAMLKAAKERAEVASRAKDDFLAALSHELRTPLTPALMITASLRQEEALPSWVRDQLSMVERNIALEARLIDDLLDLTRITRGKLQIREELCEAHHLLRQAAEIVRNEAQSKGVSLELDLAATATTVRGDPARLQQVFWNLIRNAIKFTPAGGRVTVRTSQNLGSGELQVEVSDTGIGLAPTALTRIFQPFEQAGRENDHRFGGLGLGLTIAQAIVQLHKGRIQATSEGLGKGASFFVDLPRVATGTQPTQAPSVAEESAAREEHRSLRVLLVEDNGPTLQVLHRLLSRAGHTITPASSVQEALTLAEGREFDCVVSDLGLPDGTGMDLMKTLRAQRGDLRGIALSGYGMEEDIRRSHEAGFGVHLTKPIVFEELSSALQNLRSADVESD